jgi:hypothetical protein
MKDPALLRLPADMYSPEHVAGALLELRQLESHLRDHAARAKVAKNTATPNLQVSPGVLELLHNKVTLAAVADMQKQLIAYREVAPLIRILLPATPSLRFKQQLVDWFRDAIHPGSLLQFTVRRDICGGFVLQTSGRVYDFSFRSQVLAKKERVAELLHV